MNKFYITTPIYYINDIPHIGHAYTTVAADIIARYFRQKLGEENIFFLTGTDEHGAKIATAAKEANQNPQEFADSIVPKFQEAWELLNISNNHFFRTTDPRHEKLVQEILQKIYDKGFIYEGIYEGLYCEGCEKFLTEDDLENDKCPLHPNKTPVHQKEKNYFFKLSEFEKDLITKFENDEVKILPNSKKNEILGKLKSNGLKDIAISREGVSWGITIPWDTKQTIYVWVEALFNYFTATKFLDNKEDFWPADVHFIGKDILWFHTVIWCALLKAAELPNPKSVFAHGFFTINGTKMSKSLGNVISPQELVEKFGVDATRYLLVSQFPFGQDGDFSMDKLTESYNANLANSLGNLISRVAKLCERVGFEANQIDQSFYPEIVRFIEGYEFDSAISFIQSKISEIDKKINETEPWKLNETELKNALEIYVGEIRKIEYNLKPFTPNTSEKIKNIFNKKNIKLEAPLFPRI